MCIRKTAYKLRNKYMIEHSDVVIAVYDAAKRSATGTGQTVRMAERSNKPILYINPYDYII